MFLYLIYALRNYLMLMLGELMCDESERPCNNVISFFRSEIKMSKDSPISRKYTQI